MQANLRVYRRDDGILVFEPGDTSVETVQQWAKAVSEALDTTTAPAKHIQDFRQLGGLSIFAMRKGLQVKGHPNIHWVNVVILANHSRVVELTQTILNIQPGGDFRLMTDETAAVAWLNSQAPD